MTKDEDGRDGDDRLSESAGAGDEPPMDRLRIVDSHLIFSGHREAWIRHGDDMYRLRITSAGKLYLSK